ncbi:MAG: nuclear transport factor 2 family protein [Candidatus Krumholzibacteria bacterium]
MIWNRFALALSMVACLACATGEKPMEQNSAATDAIRTNSKAFETAFNARDVEGMVRLMGEEYIDWNHGEPVWDKTRQRAVWQGVFAGMNARLRVAPAEVVVAGNWAMVRGEFTLTPDGESPTVERRYMELWRKQEDGTWRVRWGMDAMLPNSTSAAQGR